MPPTQTRGSRWCFTLNNPTNEDEGRLSSLECITYLVFGRETAPTTGTSHLQGFVIFNSTLRFSRVRELLGERCHIERTRGTSQQARDYCTKEGDFTEIGTFPSAQGRRTDLIQLRDWVDEFIRDNGRAPTRRELARDQFAACLRYRDLLRVCQLRAPPPVLRNGSLRPWQEILKTELEAEPNDRSVLFYVDLFGGQGKSWFQQYMLTNHSDDVQCIGIGKRDDIAYAIDETKGIFMFNVPRECMQFLQYPILEQLKDRMVFSTKYASEMKILCKVPHVVVFCNEAPDNNKMSQDRYDIRELN